MVRRPAANTVCNSEPITYQYMSIVIQSAPQTHLNRESSRGWECFAVCTGGFDVSGKYCPAAQTLCFRRPWTVPKNDRVPDPDDDGPAILREPDTQGEDE